MFSENFFLKLAGSPDKRVAKVAVTYQGKLLMGKRRDSGKWTDPGGHLEPGEDARAGAAREVLEETGITPDMKDLKHLSTTLVRKPNGKTIKVYIYHLAMDEKPPTSMKQDPDGEVHRWHWISIKGGLPKHVLSSLHVPLKNNCLLKAMGLVESEAFWQGFRRPSETLPKASLKSA